MKHHSNTYHMVIVLLVALIYGGKQGSYQPVRTEATMFMTERRKKTKIIQEYTMRLAKLAGRCYGSNIRESHA